MVPNLTRISRYSVTGVTARIIEVVRGDKETHQKNITVAHTNKSLGNEECINYL
jgi:hypothetical protein